jgi:two-component system, cell cycle sensor histidine kinase and response regulator CckA
MATHPRKATILVVDDEIQLRQLLARKLRSEGYTVLEAGYGLEALQVARESAEPVDLVLSDIVMPGMIGTELARHLAEEHPGIRVVLMSAHAVGSAAIAIEPEVNLPVLSKPFDGRRMLALVELVLSTSPTAITPAESAPD